MDIGTDFTRKRLERAARTAALALLIVAASLCAAFASERDVTLQINGKTLEFSEYLGIPYINNDNRTMVPVRLPMETYGCEVTWNQDLQRVSVKKDGRTVDLFIGRPVIYVDGLAKPIDTSPVLENSRTYLPIRAVFEAFDASVEWDAATYTVSVFSPDYEASSQASPGALTGPDQTQSGQTTPAGIVTSSAIAPLHSTKTVEYKWSTGWGRSARRWTYTAELSDELYDYYRSRPRGIYSDEDYIPYLTDSYDDGQMARLAVCFDEAQETYGMTEFEKIELMIAFVQSLEYVADEEWTQDYDEYPKYPYETLYDGCGDCEDTSVLLAAMLREAGYGCALIFFPDHMAVGIAGGDGIYGTYYRSGGYKYFYVETTSPGWGIGEVPDEYAGMDAWLYVVEPE